MEKSDAALSTNFMSSNVRLLKTIVHRPDGLTYDVLHKRGKIPPATGQGSLVLSVKLAQGFCSPLGTPDLSYFFVALNL